MLERMLEQQSLPWQTQLLMRELTQPSAAGTELVRQFIRPIYEFLWGIVREIVGHDVSEEQVHLIAFSIVGQAFYLRIAARRVAPLVVGEGEYAGYSTERLAQHIADFSLAALGVESMDLTTLPLTIEPR
jgi:hypothetical protein